MEIYVVCNIGYEECEFLCAFEKQSEAIAYINRKWGEYDNIIILKTPLGGGDRGCPVFRQQGFMTS
jgi:hypothetical protein